jgi:hypothetical protein
LESLIREVMKESTRPGSLTAADAETTLFPENETELK